jgi:hypothetical protein
MNNEIKIKIQDLSLEIGEVYKGCDWLVVKKYILKYLNPKLRIFFSKRNIKTKKHTLNDFEKQLIIFYENKFDIRLTLDEDKQHKD